MKFAKKFWSSKLAKKKADDGVDKIIPNKDDDDTSKQESSQKVFVYRRQSHYYNKRRSRIPPSDITHVSVHPGTRKIQKMVFEAHPAIQSIIVIPSSNNSRLKKIGWKSFKGCPSLVEVQLGEEGLIKIASEAFRNCPSLTGSIANIDDDDDDARTKTATTTCLTIPRTVETIGWWAFQNCTSLVNLRFHPQGMLEQLDHSVFGNCTSLVRVSQLPQRLQRISIFAFAGCTSLKEIELPDSLKELAGHAFENCRSLSEISFPEGMDVLGAHCFAECSSLVHVEFRQSLHQQQEQVNPVSLTIYDQAFRGCTSLSAIALPSTLHGLCFKVFDGCTNLLGVEFAPNCGIVYADSCFANCKSLVNVSFPPSVVDEGDAFLGWEPLHEYAPCLKERYARFPVHQVCYHSSTTATVDNLKQAILLQQQKSSSNNNNKTIMMMSDEFGMTPFHVVATSANPRVEILQCLLDDKYCDYYPHYFTKLQILCRQDDHGKTMMDYLLMHTSGNRVVPLIHMVLLQIVLDDGLLVKGGWDPTKKWRLILQKVLDESMPRANGMDGAKSRYHMVHDSFFYNVGHCMRIELTLLLELALWKLRLTRSCCCCNVVHQMTSDDETSCPTTNDESSRQVCRLQSCAGVVIENVAECLWGDETKSSTALSFFPICSSSWY